MPTTRALTTDQKTPEGSPRELLTIQVNITRIPPPMKVEYLRAA